MLGNSPLHMMFASPRLASMLPVVVVSGVSHRLCIHGKNDTCKLLSALGSVKATCCRFENQRDTCAVALLAKRRVSNVRSLRFSRVECPAPATVMEPNRRYWSSENLHLYRRMFASLDDSHCSEGACDNAMNSSTSSVGITEPVSESLKFTDLSEVPSEDRCPTKSCLAEGQSQNAGERFSSTFPDGNISSIGAPSLSGIIRSMRHKSPLVITDTDIQRSMACAATLLASGARSSPLGNCTSEFSPGLAKDADAILMSSSVDANTKCIHSEVCFSEVPQSRVL